MFLILFAILRSLFVKGTLGNCDQFYAPFCKIELFKDNFREKKETEKRDFLYKYFTSWYF